MDKLKPCPFCGRHRAKLLSIDDEGNGFSAACFSLTCKGSSGIYETREEAIRAWNRRTCECANNATATPAKRGLGS